MKVKSLNPNQLSFLDERLADQLNPKYPLYRLADRIPWDVLEKKFVNTIPIRADQYIP